MTGAGTEAERDVVDLLLEQHDEIRSLFAEIPRTEGAVKRGLFEDLVRLLAVHESAEETVVHPVARRKLDGGEQVVEARLAEEDRAKRELAALHDLGTEHPDFDQRLERFAADVIEHATMEEAEEFLRLRPAVDPDQLRSMAHALEVAESAASTQSDPPPAAVFDRVRAALHDWRQQHLAD
jgi:hemerythrin superfamily protein